MRDKAFIWFISMRKIISVVVLLCCLGALSAQAQWDAPSSAPVLSTLSYQELDQLVGPIALYPDPLITQILMGATMPTQVVLADRYVSGGGNQFDQMPWDGSVQALAHYPDVLRWMDDNLSWTTALGQAFVVQQQDVMDSIQRLRAQAVGLGNLQTGAQVQLVADGNIIEIQPVDQFIYVPVYAPEVIYFQRRSGGPLIIFGGGFPIGSWMNCDFDWNHRALMIWNRNYPRPANWWRMRPEMRAALMNRHSVVWRR